jgi:hypothetical protein
MSNVIDITTYLWPNGYVLSREWDTLDAGGNRANGFWVLRDSEQNVLCINQYRNDIFERFKLDPKDALSVTVEAK